MRRGRTFKHGRLVPILFAGTVGYVIGGWQAAISDSDSVAQSIALRFPQEWNTASPAAAAVGVPTAAPAAATVSTIKAMQFALFSPIPMVPQPNPEPLRDVSAAAAMPATAEEAGSSLTANTGAPPMPARPRAAAARSGAEAPAAAVAVRHPAVNRPGYLLDDAQIASIKERLHLTADQEPMWPAVEAALRNIAYARLPAGQRRGAQLAVVDPDGVNGLKFAAAPLLMSFNDEQKQEVRDLAHVMGLDQLASQF